MSVHDLALMCLPGIRWVCVCTLEFSGCTFLVLISGSVATIRLHHSILFCCSRQEVQLRHQQIDSNKLLVPANLLQVDDHHFLVFQSPKWLLNFNLQVAAVIILMQPHTHIHTTGTIIMWITYQTTCTYIPLSLESYVGNSHGLTVIVMEISLIFSLSCNV